MCACVLACVHACIKWWLIRRAWWLATDRGSLREHLSEMETRESKMRDAVTPDQ